MSKLGIPVGVILALLQLPIALQAVVLIVEELPNSYIADRMMLPREFGGERPGAFADPSQGRFRIATGAAVNQVIQRCRQRGIRYSEVFASRTRATNAPCHRGVSRLDFTYTLGNGFPRQTTSTVDQVHSTIAQSDSFVGGHYAPGPLIEKWPNGLELLRQHRNGTHGK